MFSMETSDFTTKKEEEAPQCEQDDDADQSAQRNPPNQRTSGKRRSESKGSRSNESSDGVTLPLRLIKALRRKTSSAVGSSSSNGGSGNNSDNSGLISIGNGSFGFNFDSEEGMMNGSPPNSEGDGKTGESDSDGNGPPDLDSRRYSKKAPAQVSIKSEKPESNTLRVSTSGISNDSSQGNDTIGNKSVASTLTDSSMTRSNQGSSHDEAAAAAVANLQSIASFYSSHARVTGEDETPDTFFAQQSSASSSQQTASNKRACSVSGENDSGGYNSDDSSTNGFSVRSHQDGDKPRKRSKKVDENKREERNAREKERSFRISRQINELRSLLSSGGVIVPKGTKSSVLTEAANYIRMLQQHQYRSEIDRHQLVQQMQMIGGGALGPQAANAVRHVAAQNGVWSLGNFGGVPPKSAMTYYQGSNGSEGNTPDAAQSSQQQGTDAPLSTAVEEHEYRFVFNSCSVGMAIASMGGAFIDCNQLFCQLSNFSKQEVCSMTIFNLTSRQDLQLAFDLISQMISPPTDGRQSSVPPKPCVLRGSMKNRSDLGLSVALIKGDDGIAKCFCVTLIKNPASPFDPSRPVPATADLVSSISMSQTVKASSGNLNSSPAYTTG